MLFLGGGGVKRDERKENVKDTAHSMSVLYVAFEFTGTTEERMTSYSLIRK